MQAADTSISILLSLLVQAPAVARQINDCCAALGLPPAFKTQTEPFSIQGNKDYRFNGFGATILPSQVFFYVHYKIDSAQHVEVGQFFVPVKLDELTGWLGKLGAA